MSFNHSFNVNTGRDAWQLHAIVSGTGAQLPIRSFAGLDEAMKAAEQGKEEGRHPLLLITPSGRAYAGDELRAFMDGYRLGVKDHA